jgi:hypothetical protein
MQLAILGAHLIGHTLTETTIWMKKYIPAVFRWQNFVNARTWHLIRVVQVRTPETLRWPTTQAIGKIVVGPLAWNAYRGILYPIAAPRRWVRVPVYWRLANERCSINRITHFPSEGRSS